jgi:hypothetical protein
VTAVSPVESTFIESHAPYQPGTRASAAESLSRITLVDLEQASG